eukprot:5182821-Prymnesium_polylepis.1
MFHVSPLAPKKSKVAYVSLETVVLTHAPTPARVARSCDRTPPVSPEGVQCPRQTGIRGVRGKTMGQRVPSAEMGPQRLHTGTHLRFTTCMRHSRKLRNEVGGANGAGAGWEAYTATQTSAHRRKNPAAYVSRRRMFLCQRLTPTQMAAHRDDDS